MNQQVALTAAPNLINHQQQVLKWFQQQFEDQEQRFTAAAQSLACKIRQDAETREMRLQEQIHRVNLQNQSLQSQVRTLESKTAIQQIENQGIQDCLEQSTLRIRKQEQTINNLSQQLHQTKRTLRSVKTQLEIAQDAIALTRLNEEIRTISQIYAAHRAKYMQAYEAYHKISQKKVIVHGTLTTVGAAVAGAPGAYLLGSAALANLVHSNTSEVSLYQVMANEMHHMNVLWLQIQGFSKSNQYAKQILATLQQVPRLPARPL